MNAPLPQHHSLKTLTAFILAGERPNVIDPVAAAGGVALKALLPIGGVPMLLRVITSLRAVPAIGQIVVCASRLEFLAKIIPVVLKVPFNVRYSCRRSPYSSTRRWP